MRFYFFLLLVFSIYAGLAQADERCNTHSNKFESTFDAVATYISDDRALELLEDQYESGSNASSTSKHQNLLEDYYNLTRSENSHQQESLNASGRSLLQDSFNYRLSATAIHPVPNAGSLGSLDLHAFEANPSDYVVLYHGTARAAANNILHGGVDLNRGRGEFGRGFYTTTDPGQAYDWAIATNVPENDVVVLQIIIKRSAIEHIYNQNRHLNFDLGAANAHSPQHYFFENFTNANRYLRSMDQDLPQTGVDLISGPSISSAGRTFDQHLFGDTPGNRELFSSNNDQLTIRPVTVTRRSNNMRRGRSLHNLFQPTFTLIKDLVGRFLG